MTASKLKRVPDVLEAFGLSPSSRSTLNEWKLKGVITPPVRIGRATAWPTAEIDALVNARLTGADDDDLRALVDRLLKLRQFRRIQPDLNTEDLIDENGFPLSDADIRTNLRLRTILDQLQSVAREINEKTDRRTAARLAAAVGIAKESLCDAMAELAGASK